MRFGANSFGSCRFQPLVAGIPGASMQDFHAFPIVFLGSFFAVGRLSEKSFVLFISVPIKKIKIQEVDLWQVYAVGFKNFVSRTRHNYTCEGGILPYLKQNV